MNKDCFANIDGGCSALTVTKCPEHCKFYKPTWKLRMDRRKSYARLQDMGLLGYFEKYEIPKE